jgi:molybdate transport system substrate-binding protein
LRRVRLAALLAAALLPGWCAAAAAGSAPAASGSASLRVFAAASLTEAFREINTFDWCGREPRAELYLAGSSTLVAQIEQGAPADLVATADRATLQRLVQAGRVEAPRRFAQGELVVAVEAGNPKRVRGLADLARDDLIVVLAAPEVPAGRLAREALAAAGVAARPRSLEPSVRGVVGKLLLGEADAGIVYRSDVVAAGGRIAALPAPEAAGLRAEYWIAPLRDSARPELARAFVEAVLSPRGQAVLARLGFVAEAEAAR